MFVLQFFLLICSFKCTNPIWEGSKAEENRDELSFISIRLPIEDDGHTCGGAIVRSSSDPENQYRFGFSSGRCLCTPGTGQRFDNWREYSALFGQYFQFPSGPDPPHNYERRNFTSVICHPDYRDDSRTPDLVWFRVDPVVPQRDNNPMVKALEVCTHQFIYHGATTCHVIGLGAKNIDRDMPRELQKLPLHIHRNSADCGITQTATPALVDKVICATSAGHHGSRLAQGDSGSPMICVNRLFTTEICLAGILSGTDPNDYTKFRFTRLSAYPLQTYMNQLPGPHQMRHRRHRLRHRRYRQ